MAQQPRLRSVPKEQSGSLGCWKEAVMASPATSSPETDGGTVRSLEALLGFTVLWLKLTSWVTNSVPPSRCSGWG